MTFDPDKDYRRSVRLRGFDYDRSGAYFVTICTHRRECLLGSVANDAVTLSDIGEVVAKRWIDLPRYFPRIELDAFVIMPNHLHGVVIVTDEGRSKAFADEGQVASQGRSANDSPKIPTSGTQPQSLGAIIQNFKSTSTFAVNRRNGTPGTALWQRNYYEHVIRDERTLGAVRQYIQMNPLAWALDPDNPDANSLADSKMLQRYGLTEEEADLVVSYDTKYRARQR